MKNNREQLENRISEIIQKNIAFMLLHQNFRNDLREISVLFVDMELPLPPWIAFIEGGGEAVYRMIELSPELTEEFTGLCGAYNDFIFRFGRKELVFNYMKQLESLLNGYHWEQETFITPDFKVSVTDMEKSGILSYFENKFNETSI